MKFKFTLLCSFKNWDFSLVARLRVWVLLFVWGGGLVSTETDTTVSLISKLNNSQSSEMGMMTQHTIPAHRNLRQEDYQLEASVHSTVRPYVILDPTNPHVCLPPFCSSPSSTQASASPLQL